MDDDKHTVDGYGCRSGDGDDHSCGSDKNSQTKNN